LNNPLVLIVPYCKLNEKALIYFTVKTSNLPIVKLLVARRADLKRNDYGAGNNDAIEGTVAKKLFFQKTLITLIYQTKQPIRINHGQIDSA
jgi:hypothetical protein